jgi:hypothetical protein
MAAVPISLFVRFAIMTSAAVYANWDTISGLFDRAVSNASSPIYGYYCQHVFQMKDSGGGFSDKERGMFGVHYVNTTGGDLDTTWTTADFTAVETAVQTFWSAIAAQISTDFRLYEHRWYPFGPGVHPPNPPSRITTLGTPIVGTGGAVSPHQLACTVTLRTPVRRHWGRIYLPVGLFTSVAGGQGNTAVVDAIANGARTMFLSPSTSQGVVPIVWDRQRHAALGVTAIEVDSVPDIIRRRRPKVASYKKILTS